MAGKADDPGRWFIEQAARADDLADLAELLRHLRRRQARREREAPLTYRELAGRTGWAPATISMYFTGRILPGTDRLDLMAALLGASPLEQG
ncbi:MAG TPA: helix-turn-helix transcriptional regulator, partial [Rugosimonospora sp.]|nr:helix-turn-helix transcriptional regulator [Rugosimonospora sp.]